MASELDRILAEMAEMRRRMAMMMRHGTIHEVGTGDKKGLYRISWGKQKIGGEEKPYLGPWQRVSQNHGFAAENMPLVKGQTVTSVSMDPNHMSALVFPHSDSELNPMDADASDDAHTYRIRKKPEEQGQQADEGGDPKYPERKDDEDDFKIKRSYDGLEVSAGKDVQLKVTRTGITMKYGDQEVSLTAEGWTHKTKSFKGVEVT